MLNNKVITFPIKMTEHVHKIISDAAAREGMTKQDFILYAIDEKLEKEKASNEVK